MGFWIKVPDTAASNEYEVYMLGEVPDRFSAPTSTTDIASGSTLVGYMYPSEILWTNTHLARNAVIGDMMYYWDGTNYIANNKTFMGWSDPNLLITPDMGFWFCTSRSGTNWVEVKPYTWP
ncbi:MAG TPA: hypothetical protein ENF52_07665 [Chloroflexi bacterium]|nr:hypothetical protein [Chloroflexota bacterium]